MADDDRSVLEKESFWIWLCIGVLTLCAIWHEAFDVPFPSWLRDAAVWVIVMVLINVTIKGIDRKISGYLEPITSLLQQTNSHLESVNTNLQSIQQGIESLQTAVEMRD